jgi:hypothetical protein
MQSFSAEIPWVLVEPHPQGGLGVLCDVCGEEGYLSTAGEVSQFAAHHVRHQAPAGSLRLGDAVAAVAGPVARAFGKAPCTPCEARRRSLNRFGF